MTVKSSISFTERHHQFARQKVDDGVYNSVSSLVALGIERLMQDEAEREIMLQHLSETMARRLETPRESWIAVDNEDTLFEKAKQRLIDSE